MKICFLTKKEKPYVEQAINYLSKISKKIDIYDGSSTRDFPLEILDKKYDIVIAYICGWIVPRKVLNNTKKWSINFHPGPPEYPGVGCFNFALYDLVKEYGSTANIMEPKVDTGRIIAVNRFPVDQTETVESLATKTYESIFELFKEVIDEIFFNKKLPSCNETWKRKPFRRSELEKLSQIDLDMDEDEVNKIIRSTYYKGRPSPFIKIYNKKFEYNPER